MNDLLFDNKHVDALIFSFAICYGFLCLLTGLLVYVGESKIGQSLP